MHNTTALLFLLLVLASTNVHSGGDPAAGKIKAYTCTGCHGIAGYKNTYPMYHVPRIGGQNTEYVVISLKAFKAGERTHSNMNLQAEALTDQDIDDIAVYLSVQTDQPGAGSAGNVTRGQSKSAVCHACHGPTGNAVQPIYPDLGGQHQDYLEKTLRAFRDGSRPNAIMSGFATNLSDTDIEDLAAWYSSQSGLTEIQDK